MTEHGFYVDRPWTWRDRLRARLFPETGPPEVPGQTQPPTDDVIHTNVRSHLSLVDRLRVLVSGRVLVRVRVGTAAPVTTTFSVASVTPVWRHDGAEP